MSGFGSGTVSMSTESHFGVGLVPQIQCSRDISNEFAPRRPRSAMPAAPVPGMFIFQLWFAMVYENVFYDGEFAWYYIISIMSFKVCVAFWSICVCLVPWL